MPRTDRSSAILTGMIIAALYVILLVGFSQESYMRRDAVSRTADASRAEDASRAPTIQNVLKEACNSDLPLCAALFSDLGEQHGCVTAIDAARRYLNAPAAPLGLEGIRRAMREQP